MRDPRKYAVERISELYKNRIIELQEEPEFQWKKDSLKYAVDGDGEPLVKVAIGNVPLDYDLWEGLRNPAMVGLYPAGLREIWEYHANKRKDSVDEHGRQTIFQIPRPFKEACRRFNRAVIISVMLPFSPKVIEGYLRTVHNDADRSSYLFRRMYEDVNLMINRTTERVGMELASVDGVVIAMNDDNIGKISREAIPVTHQGVSHGPSKGVNFPQKSLAALLGLGQFGVSRIIFRDECVDSTIQRFVGPIRSIVAFDEGDPVMDGSDGIIYPSNEWRRFLFRLYDFTETDPGINRFRHCTYIPLGDDGCGKCIQSCPPGAQANSVPSTDGGYSDQVATQSHRFWEGKLQFDYARCCETRGQMAALFPEWSCARCVSVCAAEGDRRKG
ncbi:MAG: hypothetical protein PVJ38_08475, partial [Candidatus Bathyarchaeota archaeon]